MKDPQATVWSLAHPLKWEAGGRVVIEEFWIESDVINLHVSRTTGCYANRLQSPKQRSSAWMAQSG